MTFLTFGHPRFYVKEAAGDRHRWEVTLARWSASRGFPSFDPLREFYPQPASAGIDRYLNTPTASEGAEAEDEDEEEGEVRAPAPATLP